jgi:hypothetical protein
MEATLTAVELVAEDPVPLKVQQGVVPDHLKEPK